MNRKLIAVAALIAGALAAAHFGLVEASTLGVLGLAFGGVLTEKHHAGEFLLSEADGTRSRENVTIVSGQVLEAGTVLGKITAGGKYAIYANGASDGTEVAAGVLLAGVDASAGDKLAAIIARDAEVIEDALVFQSEGGAAETAGVADLLTLGIICR